MNREYNPDVRENDPLYLLRQSQELLAIAINRKSSSPIIYACLDMRIALEILDLHMVLTSVGHDERLVILEDSKPKNGIDKVGRKTGVLKEKYQLFFQAICEVVGLESKSFDFKISKDLQYKLSTYIHSYHFLNDELNYDSSAMQRAIKIINESQTFIKTSLVISDEYGSVVGLEIATLPNEDKLVLLEWKNSNKMTYEELKEKLAQNINLRT